MRSLLPKFIPHINLGAAGASLCPGRGVTGEDPQRWVSQPEQIVCLQNSKRLGKLLCPPVVAAASVTTWLGWGFAVHPTTLHLHTHTHTTPPPEQLHLHLMF